MPTDGSENSPPEWFCLRSQAGRQNVAAAHLRSFGVEVFNPHLRRKHATRRGVEMRSEPLFPNYLFARFVFQEHFRRVRYGFGVSNILKFGDNWCVIPDAEVQNLKSEWGPGEALELPVDFHVGQQVRLSGTLFYGVETEVLCLLPARRRVRVLLDLLGGPKVIEVPCDTVAPVLSHPLST